LGTAWREAGARLRFAWPEIRSSQGQAVPAKLVARHQGSGKPWLTLQVRGAVPLSAAQYAGFEVRKEIVAIERKKKGRWSKGDVVEVRLSISAPTRWTWVVVDDPIPTGATILGSGLGRESILAASGVHQGQNGWWSQPAHVERAFDAYRAYYEYFLGTPQHPVRMAYRMRLNNAGEFVLPTTHVEAMYAPENFGALPNAVWSVDE
jgi:uncharacterized protein YfaS (alpha-2-macroglobulin family)